MSPIQDFNEFPPEERETLAALAELANGLQPDERFVKQTTRNLTAAFTKKEKTMKRFNLIWQILAGTAATAALVLGISWLVGSVAPQPRVPALPLEVPVATSLPPTATATSILTEAPLPIVTAEPPFDYTVVEGDTCLSIAATFNIPVESIIALNDFPADCSTLTIDQQIKIPAPASLPWKPATIGTLEPGTYDWHGTHIKLAVEFPAAPAEAGVYTHSAFEPATVAAAQAMAARFGIQGQVYLDNSGVNGPKIYLVTDGKQRLTFISAGQFSYYADYTQADAEAPVTLEAASAPIDAFLKAHGFDFAYRLEAAGGLGAGWFYALPLTLAGTSARYEFGLAQRLEVRVSPDGQVLGLNVYLLNLDAQPVGQFGLLSAEDAWQKVLTDAPFGVLQSSHSGSSERFIWYRRYADDQPATLYGNIANFPAAEAGQPPLVTLDGFPLTGNTAGMEKLDYSIFAQASGQFFAKNGVRKFRVETWQMIDQANVLYLDGNFRKTDEKVVFSSQGTDYSLPDAPADLPLPLENASVTGVVDGTTLNWQNILYFPHPGRGGGGCGGSLAQLNLSGPPVPWPTLAPAVTPAVLPVGQKVEGVRGTLSVNIFEQTDGSQRTEYNFYSPDAQYLLQGQGLKPLDGNHNRPLTVWGTVTGYNQFQLPILTLERFEIPFPGLQFQILRGTQKLMDLNGQPVTLFTSENGKTYVQTMSNGQPDSSLIGVEGDLVAYEVLLVPKEAFDAYPVMRVFSGGMATNPKNGQPYAMEITADQPYVMPEPQPQPGNTPAPVLTIDSIELVYYTPDPRNAPNNPDATSPYLQPVWRFHGYYADGSEAEFLIQALKPDFLLPESAYGIECG
jgi:LysM repeat protein